MPSTLSALLEYIELCNDICTTYELSTDLIVIITEFIQLYMKMMLHANNKNNKIISSWAKIGVMSTNNLLNNECEDTVEFNTGSSKEANQPITSTPTINNLKLNNFNFNKERDSVTHSLFNDPKFLSKYLDKDGHKVGQLKRRRYKDTKRKRNKSRSNTVGQK